MVVVVLIGILVAAVAPQMSGAMDDAVFRGTTRKVIQSLAYARSQAVTTGAMTQWRSEPETGLFRIERQERPTPTTVTMVPAGDTRFAQGSFDQRVIVLVEPAPASFLEPTMSRPSGDPFASQEPGPSMLEAPDATIPNIARFYPDGSADAVMILIEDRAGFVRRLRVNPLTGTVSFMTEP